MSKLRMDDMDSRNGLQVGDQVTSTKWDGNICTIAEFSDGLGESAAIFTNGGFWRVSQLVKIAGQPSINKETT